MWLSDIRIGSRSVWLQFGNGKLIQCGVLKNDMACRAAGEDHWYVRSTMTEEVRSMLHDLKPSHVSIISYIESW